VFGLVAHGFPTARNESTAPVGMNALACIRNIMKYIADHLGIDVTSVWCILAEGFRSLFRQQ
jgi:hypothetical protein